MPDIQSLSESLKTPKNLNGAQVVRVLNISGAPILGGRICKLGTVLNNIPSIALANSSTDGAGKRYVVVPVDIPNGEEGWAFTSGMVAMDTTGITAGVGFNTSGVPVAATSNTVGSLVSAGFIWFDGVVAAGGGDEWVENTLASENATLSVTLGDLTGVKYLEIDSTSLAGTVSPAAVHVKVGAAEHRSVVHRVLYAGTLTGFSVASTDGFFGAYVSTESTAVEISGKISFGDGRFLAWHAGRGLMDEDVGGVQQPASQVITSGYYVTADYIPTTVSLQAPTGTLGAGTTLRVKKVK